MSIRLIAADLRYKDRALDFLRGAATDFEALSLPMHAAAAWVDLAYFYLFARWRRIQWSKARHAIGRALRLSAHGDTRVKALRLLLALIAARKVAEFAAKYRELRSSL